MKHEAQYDTFLKHGKYAHGVQSHELMPDAKVKNKAPKLAQNLSAPKGANGAKRLLFGELKGDAS